MNKSGVATILIVFLISMMAIFVMVGWQSRLLLSIQRNRAVSDVLVATYNAESVINDVIARFVGGFPQLPYGPQPTLPDGTVLNIDGSVLGNVETLVVSASRPFASSKIELTKITDVTAETNIDKVEMVMAMDCSSSMNEKADPTCSGAGCPTRMEKAKEAMLDFLDEMNGLNPLERDKYYLGLLVFKKDSRWVSDSFGDLTPINDLSRLTNAVNSRFGNNVGSSLACNFPNPFPGAGETNLGAPTVKADDYFAGTSHPRTKQVYILVTDGLPNTSLQENRCGTLQCGGSFLNSPCGMNPINYLKCGLADVNTFWDTGKRGLRDPEVDTYAVTLLSQPTNSHDLQLFNIVTAILGDHNYVDGYYSSSNAGNLSDFLDEIFNQVVTSVTSVNIRRVVPTPIR